jgi:two-component system response regulator PilR (NtrC family)
MQVLCLSVYPETPIALRINWEHHCNSKNIRCRSNSACALFGGTRKVAEIDPSKLVLLAEDDRDVQKVLSVTVRHLGYAVECAGDGNQALESFDRLAGRVILVLTDLRLPGRNGIEVVREIRRRDKHVPIIMISGASTPNEAAEAIKSGANDFLSKPFDLGALRKVIRTALDAEATPATPAASPEALSGMSAIESSLDQVALSDVPVL